MTNGIAYVYDPEGAFPGRINGESVLLEPIHGESDAGELRSLVAEHFDSTASKHAHALLENWTESLGAFWKVMPRAALAARAEAAAAAAEAELARGVAD